MVSAYNNFNNNKAPKYDLNNNEALLSEGLSSQYYDLINRSLDSNQSTKLNKKFQQPNFSLDHNLVQAKIQKKPLVKIHSQIMTNDRVRVGPTEIVLKQNQAPIDNQVMNGLDSHQRMTLVKLLHTTMDAT